MAFSDPKKIVRQMGIFEGMHVADFGSGSGHYTLLASDMVGESGRVYAVDIQRELLKKVKNLSKSEHRDNIDVIVGDIDEPGGSKLASSIIDIIIFSNVLFQLEKKESAVKEIKRVLKSSGRVVVIDWSDSFKGIGPPPQSVVTAKAAKKLFEEEGFILERDIDTGLHHYGFIMKKQ